MPNTKRPPDSRSRLATALAVTIGSRCATRQIPVPTTSRSVTAAAIARATNGSRVRLYSSASSASPVGGGVRRLVGMWVCSGTYSEYKPRASISRASSTGPTVWSVMNIVTPKCNFNPPFRRGLTSGIYARRCAPGVVGDVCHSERREVVPGRTRQGGEVFPARKTERRELTLHLVTHLRMHEFPQLLRVLALQLVPSVDRGRDPVRGKLTLGDKVLLELGGDRPELLLHLGANRLPQLFDAVPATAADQLVDRGRDLLGCLPSLFD